jgi:glyoxylase-like metal-dependent hydrolase (beta-lactamase superfamily II)
MIFRQLFDPESSTYTYVIGDEATREAVVVDPVLGHERRDLDTLSQEAFASPGCSTPTCTPTT